MPSVCAYCEGPGPFTREHLWPAGLWKRFTADATVRPHFFLDRSAEKFVLGQPKIRDVCASCNNGELSRLDAYACQLYDSALFRQFEDGDCFVFDYNYERLLRWLLKIAFNSARIHRSETGILAYYSKYILGEFSRPRNVRLFAELIRPAVVTQEQEATTGVKAGTKFYPDRLRVGHVALANLRPIIDVTGRSIIVNAFAFSVFIGDRNAPGGYMFTLENAFASACPASKLLKPDESKVELTCRGLDANEALVWHYRKQRKAYGSPWQEFEKKHLKG